MSSDVARWNVFPRNAEAQQTNAFQGFLLADCPIVTGNIKHGESVSG